VEIRAYLLALLSNPNIASKEAIVRVYDHEIQGGTAVKPLVGVNNEGPSDACVIKPIGTNSTAGIVLSNGINPWYGDLDAYHMAFAVIDEAVRNAVAVGANPAKIAILDNFCWGDPTNPETMGSLVDALRGCYDAAIAYGTPFISGKDSLNNEYPGNDGKKHAIPPTLLISAIGVIEDVNKSITMDFKTAGNYVYFLGAHQNSFGGSHLAKISDKQYNLQVPRVLPHTHEQYQVLFGLIQEGKISACHDLSEGGLAVTAAEMCLAGDLGLDLTIPSANPTEFLFSETTASFLIEVKPEDAAYIESMFQGLPISLVGKIHSEKSLNLVSEDNEMIVSFTMNDIKQAWLRK
jgi:phosphoribosylformylglycinamidine synthase